MFTVGQRSRIVVELGAWLGAHGHNGCCDTEALVAYVEEGCKGCDTFWEPLDVPKAVDCVLVHPVDNHVWALCQHCVWDKEAHQCGSDQCPGPWPPIEEIFYLPTSVVGCVTAARRKR